MKRKLPMADVSARPGLSSAVPDLAFQRWNPDVRAVAGGDVIEVLEQIGEDWMGGGVTSKRIAAQLAAMGGRDVTVVINSPGGNYFEGLSIYNQLRDYSGKITVKIVGIAASAASVIAMAGDEVQIARAGFLMIHNAWVVASGDRHALREVSDWLTPFDATAVDIYFARTGIDRSKLAVMLDAETWIGGKDAIDQGFADAFLAADEVSAPSQSLDGNLIRAEAQIDQIMARVGLSRSARRELVAALKQGGKSSAAPSSMPSAAVGLTAILEKLKHI